MDDQHISRVAGDVAETLARDVTSSGTRAFVLPHGIHDKASLFIAIRETIPIDPPMSGSRHNWDALEDSLFSGLQSLSEPALLIIWPDASDLLQKSSKDFDMFAVILEDIARMLADPKVTNGPVKKLQIVMGGTWS